MADHIPPSDPTSWFQLILTGIAGLSYVFTTWVLTRVEGVRKVGDLRWEALDERITTVKDEMNREIRTALTIFATKQDLMRIEDSLKTDIQRIESMFREEQERQTQHLDQRISAVGSQVILAISRGNRPKGGED